jgi:hypothetical protein
MRFPPFRSLIHIVHDHSKILMQISSRISDSLWDSFLSWFLQVLWILLCVPVPSILFVSKLSYPSLSSPTFYL